MNRPEHVAEVIARAIGGAPTSLTISERQLRGGIEGAPVKELLVRFVGPRGRPGVRRFVTKELRGDLVREVEVYESLVSRHAPTLAPRIEAVVRDVDSTLVHMEHARRRSAWPWHDVELAAEVLEAVSALHASEAAVADVPRWDYEAELERRAAEATEMFARARGLPECDFAGRSAGALRRLVADLRLWRRFLLAGPLAPSAIHGDLHTGNVVATTGATARIVLLDWGRARVGSPLEDVSSWLQSLAFWEPSARRRHDTLLGRYLRARGLPSMASAAVRDAYWLAGASNALAGALAFHLDVGTSASATPRARTRSLSAARDWLRILRRADAVWARVRAQISPPSSAGDRQCAPNSTTVP